MIASVIETGELHPTFIKNDRHVSLYMMDIAVDGSRPILRINVIARSPIEPTNSFNDNDSVENENLDDQPNDSFCDQSNDNLGDDSKNGHDHSLDVEDQPIDAEDLLHFEEDEGELELRSQHNHSFSDGTNIYMYQTFCTKSELQLLLVEAAARKSFDFATVKSCSKYLKGIFSHKRKVIAVDGTHLHGKYKGVLLSVVAQYTKNHVYSIAFCVVGKENDASWTFFFEKLKDIVVDELDLCFISDRHKSIANGIAKVYNLAHHGYCMRHLDENLCVNHQCGDSLFLYYNTTKAYFLEELNDHFGNSRTNTPRQSLSLSMILVLKS
ncbi:hypothetical protein RDI58_014771 [Solanum bulbocastanum]|uniref:MULE transposase domain-containing protein n=1 Tax=Solanum bulbocastanum TaxID=147425 RepID=A0AAN8TM12_SOLBU